MEKITEFIWNNSSKLLFALFLIGIIGIFSAFLIDFGLGESGYNFLGKTKKVTLSPGAPVTQTFTAKQNNLYQIRVVLGNADIKRGESIEFRLMNETCTETFATTNFFSKPRQQGAYTVFSFSTLPDSKERHYCFMATYFSDENRKGDKPYLSAIDEPDLAFADRTLTDSNKNKVYESQTLFLRPAYTTGSLVSDLWKLVQRLSQYKPSFLQGWSMAVLFGALLTGSVVFAFCLAKKPK